VESQSNTNRILKYDSASNLSAGSATLCQYQSQSQSSPNAIRCKH
jgi:hypothetical protein